MLVENWVRESNAVFVEKTGVSECKNDEFLYISKAYACIHGGSDTEHFIERCFTQTVCTYLGGPPLIRIIFVMGPRFCRILLWMFVAQVMFREQDWGLHRAIASSVIKQLGKFRSMPG